jgi:Sec-independent protein translocase protein TatA
MFGISLGELLLIFAIALVVLGPKQLSQLASKIGIVIYSIKNYISVLKKELYYTSGANEILNTKSEIIKTYANIRKNIQEHNKIDEYVAIKPEELPQFKQAELDFKPQAELFDELNTTGKQHE